VPGVMAAVERVLRAIPGLEVVEPDVPILSTQASDLSLRPLRPSSRASCANASFTPPPGWG
jgi:hypothetical protein